MPSDSRGEDAVNPRRGKAFRPSLEPLEAKLLLNGARAAHGPREAAEVATDGELAVSARRPRFTFVRITNPTPFNTKLVPPFKQTMVQSRPPVAGQTYNLLFVSMRNSTRTTFRASDRLIVSVTGQPRNFPILSGSDEWKPGEVRVFYVVSKQYYPLRPVTSAGFQFRVEDSTGTAIPGPSGIFLRVKYNPATIAKVVNQVVAFGPGSKGRSLGLPDTSIWEFTPASVSNVPL